MAIGGALAGGGVYLGLVTGAVPIDLGLGRRLRALGPLSVEIDAPAEEVFDVLAEPYADRTSRALREKVRVLERGQDMVLAAHYTPIRGRLRATTVETVHFQRPRQIDFRLVRGPVPYVVETFTLEQRDDHTLLTYRGQLGTDLWRLGERWGDIVAPKWESVVASAFDATKDEAERRQTARRHAARHQT
ncbi:MAG: SRPBCC family protein [Geodermatophilaceae bacterium]